MPYVKSLALWFVCFNIINVICRTERPVAALLCNLYVTFANGIAGNDQKGLDKAISLRRGLWYSEFVRPVEGYIDWNL